MITNASAPGADEPDTLAADTGIATWSSLAWRTLAVSWLDERLEAAGMMRTGVIIATFCPAGA